MQKKIGITGTSGRVAKAFQMKTQQLLQAVGMNSGNLVFQYAVHNSIAEQCISIGSELPWDVKQVRENCRIIVIPAANFIREDADFSSMADFLEQVDLPLVVVGLGAQATDYGKKIYTLSKGTQKLLALFKERCKTIGVRGNYSAEVLEAMGIHNTAVIGCPSNFLNSDPMLPDLLVKKLLRKESITLANGDEPWPKDIRKRDAERKLISLIKETGGVYVLQSVAPFIEFMRSANVYQKENGSGDVNVSLQKSLLPEASVEEFNQFARSHFRIYFDVDQWLEDASRFDFSIGLRLHGNMVAFQSGTPALWITHDSRTQELAETMALPQISLERFLESRSVEELKERTVLGLSAYAKTRDQLLKKYLSILDQSSISHVWNFEQLNFKEEVKVS